MKKSVFLVLLALGFSPILADTYTHYDWTCLTKNNSPVSVNESVNNTQNYGSAKYYSNGGNGLPGNCVGKQTKQNYTITINNNGGSGGALKYNSNGSMYISNPSREAYDFTGWSTSNGNAPANNIPATFAGNVTYTANWFQYFNFSIGYLPKQDTKTTVTPPTPKSKNWSNNTSDTGTFTSGDMGNGYNVTSWSLSIGASNCGGCGDRYYGNPNFHNKKITIYGSTNGSSWQYIGDVNVYNRDQSENKNFSGSQNYRYFKVDTSGACWKNFRWNVTTNYQIPGTTKTDVIGWHLDNVSFDLGGGEVTSVVFSYNNNLTFNTDSVDKNKWSISGKKITPIVKVNSSDLTNLLKAVKWAGNVSSHNINVEINGSNIYIN